MKTSTTTITTTTRATTEQNQQQQQQKQNKTNNNSDSSVAQLDANRRESLRELVSRSININLRSANSRTISAKLPTMSLIEISQVWKSWWVLAKIRLHDKSKIIQS